MRTSIDSLTASWSAFFESFLIMQSGKWVPLCTRLCRVVQNAVQQFLTRPRFDYSLFAGLNLAHYGLIQSGALKDVVKVIAAGEIMVKQLLNLANYKVRDGQELRMSTNFPGLFNLAPSPLIVPLQSSLTVTLPSAVVNQYEHKPFPIELPIIASARLLRHKFPACADFQNGLRVRRANRCHVLPCKTSQNRHL